MRKNSKRVPSALKHGIYSGLGLLPTESRAKFRKLRKQLFAELNLVGPMEQRIGEQIAVLEWRRARARRNAIQSELVPQMRYIDPSLLSGFEPEPDPKNPTPEGLRAARRRADKRIQAELGAALELVELGDVATLEHLEKRLTILDRLDAMIARLYKKLAYVRAIKSMTPAALPAPSQPLLEKAA
jgi:hypothetical protein